jgi:creatinine amidohydrolase
MRLAELTWPSAGDRGAAGDILAVPLGSTEQHGPHLPLSTDTDIAVALTTDLESRRDDIVVAPALAYGASGEHAGFPGTLSIGQEALELLLVELGRSASETFNHLLIISTHGGNAEPVRRAAERLRGESRDVLIWMPPLTGGAHAGRTETSIELALRPTLVHQELALSGDTRPINELMPLIRASSVRSISPTGVLGDPTGASVTEGAALLTALADDLERAVQAWVGR